MEKMDCDQVTSGSEVHDEELASGETNNVEENKGKKRSLEEVEIKDSSDQADQKKVKDESVEKQLEQEVLQDGVLDEDNAEGIAGNVQGTVRPAEFPVDVLEEDVRTPMMPIRDQIAILANRLGINMNIAQEPMTSEINAIFNNNLRYLDRDDDEDEEKIEN